MTSATDRLAALGDAAPLEVALELFDALPSIAAAEITGRWRGREIATGHPMDGLLAPSGWWGKQFDDVDHVHPLLFEAASGEVYPVSPRRMPLGLAGRVPAAYVGKAKPVSSRMRLLLETRHHQARLRNVEFRGVVTAAMVYDDLPIIDVFRRVDADTLLGVMDYRAHPAPYVFVLERT
jgi:hypothetical protein